MVSLSSDSRSYALDFNFHVVQSEKGDYHVIISSKLSEMICFWKWISLWFLSGPLLGHILLTKSFYNPFGRDTTVKVPLINHLIHLITIKNSLVKKYIKILLGSPNLNGSNLELSQNHMHIPSYDKSPSKTFYAISKYLPYSICHGHPVIEFLVTKITITDVSLLLLLQGREMAFLKMSISEFTFEVFDIIGRYLIGRCIKPIKLSALSQVLLAI